MCSPFPCRYCKSFLPASVSSSHAAGWGHVLPCFVLLTEKFYCSYFLCCKMPDRCSVKQPPFYLCWRECRFSMDGYRCLTWSDALYNYTKLVFGCALPLFCAYLFPSESLCAGACNCQVQPWFCWNRP